MSSAYRRSSYASVAAGTAPSAEALYGREGLYSPRGAPSQQHDDPESNSSTPQHHSSRSVGQTGAMEGSGDDNAWLKKVSKGDFIPDHNEGWFVPSYLRSSRYMERLGAARKRNEVAREGQSSRLREINKLGSTSRRASHTNLSKLAGAHHAASRGVVQDVIERLPPIQADDVLRPIPQRWNESDRCPGLDIISDGLEIKFTGATRSPDDAVSARTDVPIPRECGIYYFEITIISRGKEGLIGIGFSSTKPSLNRLPGWETESWGYHGDDGFSFACSASGRPYGPKFSSLDVIGCGINFRTNSAFFTKNGIFLGEAFQNVKPMDRLYPSVGIKKPHEHLRANFGQRPFVFDIDSHVERERQAVRDDINKIDRTKSPLKPGLDETETIHELISQYLAHEGLIETASQFAQDVQQQKMALKPDQSDQDLTSPRDDMLSAQRQKIRIAILAGDIDLAFHLLTTHFPSVLSLDTNRDIYFRLRCRKFIEMILRSYEMQQSRVNSPSPPAPPSTAMDLDGVTLPNNESDGGGDGVPLAIPPLATDEGTNNGAMELDTSDDRPVPPFADTKSSTLLHNELLDQAIRYGMELQAEFSDDPRPEVRKALNDTFALIAYNDARQSVLADMMEGKGRVEIAEGVNGAVLVSMGQPRSALLEKLCAQTQVLLDMLGEDGGAGAFVHLRDDYLV